ncbi:hypothetical protein R1X32_10880 (plasmid) [Rhodococcus opacus]|uniref:DUF3887 domain-containing protein n=1 Tax=Rhodococcus opacus TaxID=37919 RepID=UPI0034D28972
MITNSAVSPHQPASRRRFLCYRTFPVVVLLMCVLAPAGGCSALRQATEQSSTPSVGTTAAPGEHQDTRLALQALDAIAAADYVTATTTFDEALRHRLTPGILESSWARFQEQFGRYLSHDTPQATTRGERTVVSVPLRMQRAAGEFRVTVDRSHAIAGLFFLEAGIPIP